uniref:Olfactory receptor n=1 Tax=Canis lupus familiaris TaxID=9615 RepID=A0A8P0PLX2_CANLF
MLTSHNVCSVPSSFQLTGIPGLESLHIWLSIPFGSMYLVAVVGNVTILAVVKVEHSLHQPMYFFLCMLAVIDLVLSTSTMPKLLGIFWFGAGDIGLDACLAQICSASTSSLSLTAILLVMALDRYVAICYPLRYPKLVTAQLLAGLLGAAAARSTCIVAPVVGLASQVRFCRSHIIHHFACEHMALMKLSCGDISLNKTVGLTVRIFNRVLDMLLLGASYSRIIHAAFRISSGRARSKALNTCGSHLLVIFTVYSSTMSSSIVYRVARAASQDVHNLLSAFYLLLPCLVNPFIYGARTKEIRQHLATLFQRAQLPAPPEKPQSLPPHGELPT